MDQELHSNAVIAAALIFAIFDDFLYWYTTTIEHHINCGTIGCFVSDQFRYYWGISNMVHFTRLEQNPRITFFPGPGIHSSLPIDNDFLEIEFGLKGS